MSNNTSAPVVSEWSERDDYGRTVRHFAVNGRTVCVRVTLPKVYREKYGKAYMVTDWANRDNKPQDVASLAWANAAAKAIVAREVAAASK